VRRRESRDEDGKRARVICLGVGGEDFIRRPELIQGGEVGEVRAGGCAHSDSFVHQDSMAIHLDECARSTDFVGAPEEVEFYNGLNVFQISGKWILNNPDSI